MVDDVLLGVHHRREALHAERLGRVGGDVEDVRTRRDRVCPLDIEGHLERPDVAGLQAGVLGTGRWLLHHRLAVPVDVLERRRAGRTGCAGLTAHVRRTHRVVEHLQVRGHVRVAERVDDRDRHAPAVFSGRDQRAEVVGGAHRRGREAAPRHRDCRVAVRLGWRRGRAGQELEIADRRSRCRQGADRNAGAAGGDESHGAENADRQQDERASGSQQPRHVEPRSSLTDTPSAPARRGVDRATTRNACQDGW